jgi:hypothetical protein
MASEVVSEAGEVFEFFTFPVPLTSIYLMAVKQVGVEKVSSDLAAGTVACIFLYMLTLCCGGQVHESTCLC